MIKLLRRGPALASAVLCASVLVAYGSASASSGKSSGSVINLSFWNGLTGPDKPAVNYVISQFNKTHPTIHVTSDPIPWAVLYAKLLPAFAAYSRPDRAPYASEPSDARWSTTEPGRMAPSPPVA